MIFGSAMALFILLGLFAIRRRDIARHRAWLIRSYAIEIAAGTQVLTHLPWFLLVGKTDVTSRAVLMGAG